MVEKTGWYFKIGVLQLPRGVCYVYVMLVHTDVRLCKHMGLVFLEFHVRSCCQCLGQSWVVLEISLVVACRCLFI